ncbi:MAG TPA: hypothetical protein VMH36_01810 [Alphaproteobacteria bacterium]|nr:hypothetical protein [Alphaproteobacteria bacterium]
MAWALVSPEMSWDDRAGAWLLVELLLLLVGLGPVSDGQRALLT